MLSWRNIRRPSRPRRCNSATVAAWRWLNSSRLKCSAMISSPCSATRDLLQVAEESTLAHRVDAPVDRQRLIAVGEALGNTPIVEEAPAGIDAERGTEIVVLALEIVVVVLVEDDRLAAIGLAGAGVTDDAANALRRLDVIAVHQQIVG